LKGTKYIRNQRGSSGLSGKKRGGRVRNTGERGKRKEKASMRCGAKTGSTRLDPIQEVRKKVKASPKVPRPDAFGRLQREDLVACGGSGRRGSEGSNFLANRKKRKTKTDVWAELPGRTNFEGLKEVRPKHLKREN